MDLSDDQSVPRVFINPQILDRAGEQQAEEGCLSVPGIYDSVQRAERVRVRALNRDGEPFELEADGLLAVCIQHELDHLDGKLFVDHLSSLKRERIRKKLEMEQRQQKSPEPAPRRRVI
jgi:peptide deformylase